MRDAGRAWLAFRTAVALCAGSRLSARLDPVRPAADAARRHRRSALDRLRQHRRDQCAAHRAQGSRRGDAGARRAEGDRRLSSSARWLFGRGGRARGRGGRVPRPSLSRLAEVQGRQGRRDLPRRPDRRAPGRRRWSSPSSGSPSPRSRAIPRRRRWPRASLRRSPPWRSAMPEVGVVFGALAALVWIKHCANIRAAVDGHGIAHRAGAERWRSERRRRA